MPSAPAPLSAGPEVAPPATLSVYVMVAMVAMAGPLYIDIMPAIIAALRTEYGLSPAQAGYVAASNGYGSTFGALAALFLVPRIAWRPLSAALLLALVVADLASMGAKGFEMLVVLRFLHGVAGGLLVGVTYALLAQMADPRRGFGILFIFHFGFGGVGIVASIFASSFFQQGMVFAILVAFSLIALVLLLRLPTFRQPGTGVPGRKTAPRGRWPVPLMARIGALFLFQAANLGLGAFLIGIAVDFGHSAVFAGTVVAFSLGAGVPGALIMLMLSRRYGWMPLVPVVAAAGLSKLLVMAGASPALYALAVAAIFFTMAIALPYGFALCARDDSSGRAAVLAGFASKLGLASGPAIAGILYSTGVNLLVGTAVATVMVAAGLFAFSLRGEVARPAAERS
ncbi:MFS transporter [Ancylobacter radicis]|uniref:MFS transporter n=1 Tax=Ancylobacter radicis TaxID=2836179 RepID=A0ABS5R5K0_9HYPH|nr:MFS transporter [Ancylobacter radicis]MBS9476950.1 MFS transporter [Ancylobacter radicis]